MVAFMSLFKMPGRLIRHNPRQAALLPAIAAGARYAYNNYGEIQRFARHAYNRFSLTPSRPSKLVNSVPRSGGEGQSFNSRKKLDFSMPKKSFSRKRRS